MSEKDTQTTLSDYAKQQVGLNTEAYSILRTVKNNLIKVYKKNFTFSDAVVEMDKTIKGGDVIAFTKEEVKKIKQNYIEYLT